VEGLLADATLPADVPLARMVDPAMTAAMAESAAWAVLSLHRRFFDYAAQQAQAHWLQWPQRRADEVSVLVLGAGAVDGYGNSLNNTLTGNTGNNLLFGAAGRDSIHGGDGNDTLWGTDASRRNEIDTLTGGGGSNLFVLGNASAVFYNDAYASQVGATDYAYITDFTPGEDTLQLKGSAGSYYLGSHTVAALSAHQGLFLELGSVDELIAIIQTDGAALTPANTVPWLPFSILPLWLDLDGLRVVHACWDETRMADACAKETVTDDFLVEACSPGGRLFDKVEKLLKGKEAVLPEGVVIIDKDGHQRPATRVRWFDDPQGRTFPTTSALRPTSG
jgi:hypothetical protein